MPWIFKFAGSKNKYTAVQKQSVDQNKRQMKNFFNKEYEVRAFCDRNTNKVSQKNDKGKGKPKKNDKGKGKPKKNNKGKGNSKKNNKGKGNSKKYNKGKGKPKKKCKVKGRKCRRRKNS